MESKWLCRLIRAWEKKGGGKFWWKLCFKNTSLVYFFFFENFCSNKHDFTECFCLYTTLQQVFEQEMSTWPEGHMVGFERDHGPVQQVNWLTNKVMPSKEAAVFARRLSKSRSGAKSCPHPPRPYQRCTYTSSAHQVHVMFQTKWSPIKPGDERRPAKTVNI